MLKITESVGIDKNNLIENVRGFRVSGSHSRFSIVFPRKIKIDNNFVEGYALYLAEGDTGLNGKTIPRKLRFTNSNLNVIEFFIKWLNLYFPNLIFYLNIVFPEEIDEKLVKPLCEKLKLNGSQIKLKKGYYNKKIKYGVCCDNAILIDLILSLDEIVKSECVKNEKLANAYIRGMMTGEGTIYFNRSRYVRIEMRNKKEISYLYDLLKNLDYNCKTFLRSNRENMWSIYLGAKELERFNKEIGFGSHKERQVILQKAVDKRLRKNQYI